MISRSVLRFDSSVKMHWSRTSVYWLYDLRAISSILPGSLALIKGHERICICSSSVARYKSYSLRHQSASHVMIERVVVKQCVREAEVEGTPKLESSSVAVVDLFHGLPAESPTGGVRIQRDFPFKTSNRW